MITFTYNKRVSELGGELHLIVNVVDLFGVNEHQLRQNLHCKHLLLRHLLILQLVKVEG